MRCLELVLAKPFFFYGEAPKLSRVVTINSVPAVVTTRGLPATNLRKERGSTLFCKPIEYLVHENYLLVDIKALAL